MNSRRSHTCCLATNAMYQQLLGCGYYVKNIHHISDLRISAVTAPVKEESHDTLLKFSSASFAPSVTPWGAAAKAESAGMFKRRDALMLGQHNPDDKEIDAEQHTHRFSLFVFSSLQPYLWTQQPPLCYWLAGSWNHFYWNFVETESGSPSLLAKLMGLKLPIRAWFTAVGHVWSASFSQASRLETAYRHPLCGAAVTSHGEPLETQHSLPRRQYNNECTEEHSRSVNRCGFSKGLGTARRKIHLQCTT